ncbi:MAG TPA: pyridoxamine 5'-phosphate oxidase family protein [Blastocatellia bacterium]|nr:pyridoxamine 5'-phosphate oxidase family protein [Blastocatellia bacterium]HMX29834.1 pyridoxamine 5'-phosphate oxidase family protein [Blastocatellia bacterium]HMZ21760.1 pyridoxamine 5'-phosphate oxidase family protein [Blastocatellia bacterium]HNG34747.1 pyridoxamine 5'-phosphate oxidase family protein [Blastocatellia bacterium]
MFGHLGEHEARTLLREGKVGRLGCCDQGRPYVVPVNYFFDGEFIYVHSLSGYKVDVLRANPHVCLQTDVVEDDYHWRSVIAFGVYEEISNEALRKRVLAEFLRKLPYQTPVESRLNDPAQVIVFRLCITEITGVFEQW